MNSTYLSAWNGIQNRLFKNDWLEVEFKNSLHSINTKIKVPLLQGTTDLYSYNQSSLIASGNMWSPRPILQSYAVYTSSLGAENKHHLLGARGPNNVLFKVEPLDERLPSIEDGASWPVLLTDYEPTALEQGFLYLRKRAGKSETSKFLPMGMGTHAMREVVAVPSATAPIFVKISIRFSVVGRLANLFFKPTQLQILVNLENGASKRYRIIAGMAQSGFLISPLIENTDEFALLYGDNVYSTGKGVMISPR